MEEFWRIMYLYYGRVLKNYVFVLWKSSEELCICIMEEVWRIMYLYYGRLESFKHVHVIFYYSQGWSSIRFRRFSLLYGYCWLSFPTHPCPKHTHTHTHAHTHTRTHTRTHARTHTHTCTHAHTHMHTCTHTHAHVHTHTHTHSHTLKNTSQTYVRHSHLNFFW